MMNGIDWKRKLTSRKFWAAVASFATLMIVYFGGTQQTADKTAALIMAGATVIAYIIGEGLADAGNEYVIADLKTGKPAAASDDDEMIYPDEEDDE